MKKEEFKKKLSLLVDSVENRLLEVIGDRTEELSKSEIYECGTCGKFSYVESLCGISYIGVCLECGKIRSAVFMDVKHVTPERLDHIRRGITKKIE